MEHALYINLVRALPKAIYSVVKYALYLCFYYVFTTIQHCCWTFSGIKIGLRNAAKERNYSKSAQILDIWYKCDWEISPLRPFNLKNFLYTHKEFVHPEYVLQDNISLFFLDGDNAVFAEAPPGVQFWQSKYGAFMHTSFGNHTQKLIVLPLSSLIKLGNDVGHPKQKLCFLFKTPRCGSTILTQMLEATGQCVAFSEPEIFHNLAKLYKGGDDDKKDTLTKCVINLLCKPLKNEQSEEFVAYFIKATSFANRMLPVMVRLYPKCRFLFLYRNVFSVTQSVYRINHKLPCRFLFYLGGFVHPFFLRTFMDRWNIYLPSSVRSRRCRSFVDFSSYPWCSAMNYYMQIKEEFPDFKCLPFEELIADPLEVIQKILMHLELPLSQAETTLAVMSRDSQIGTPHYTRNKIAVPKRTQQRMISISTIMVAYGLDPVHINENYIMKGSL